MSPWIGSIYGHTGLYENVDMTAYCGFSCNNCFYSEWSGTYYAE